MARTRASNGRFLCDCPTPNQAVNPRRRDTCQTCLGYIDPKWTSNATTFRAFYGRLADALPGEPWLDAFISHCQKREEAGRDKFGHDCLGRDNAVEAAEEFTDGGNYFFFAQLQKFRAGEEIPWDLLLEGAKHAALAWRAAQMLRAHRTEYLGHIET